MEDKVVVSPQKPWKWWLVGSFIFCLVLGFLLFREMKFIRAYPLDAWTEGVSSDCGVVLTGGANRIKEGIDLLYQRKIAKLIISGVNPRSSFREIFPNSIYYGALNESDIILEKRSQTTYGNAQQSLALIEALKCRDVVLITSRVHMYRAINTFKGTFPEAYPIYSHSVVPGRLELGLGSELMESLKSLFYSFWAYSS